MKDLNIAITLSAKDIDRASSELVSYLNETNTKPSETVKLRLNIEEVLLKWRDKLGENTEVVIQAKKVLGQRKISIIAEGNECNPFETYDELGTWMHSLVSHLENIPSYSYSHRTNVALFKIPRKKINPFVLLLFSVAAAIVIGLLGRLLSPDTRLQISELVLVPICSTYVNVLCFCGIPLIFLSVCLGIIGIGDIHAFSQIGLGMVKRYMTLLLFSVILALCFALPFFSLQFGQSNMTFSLSSIYTVFLSWFPINVFAPFIECNAMQLIIMGIVFGIGILKLDNKGKFVSGFFHDVNNLMLMISEWFTKLIPVFVFITLVNSFLKSDVLVLLQAGKSLLITTSVQALFVVLFTILVCIKNNVNIGLLFRKLFDLFLIALGTNSCSASIPEHYKLSSTKLGIPENVFSFGIPIGTSVFKPATAIRYVILIFFMAVEYRINVAPSWLIMVAFVCIFLSIASPAIPGGALLLCPMLFSQLGIPAEAINQMLATDIFFDAICTSFNQVSVQLALTQYSGSLGVINKEVLVSKKSN